MVRNIPHVNVTHREGLLSRTLGVDQTLGCVIECTKGTPNEAVLISTPGALKREFGVEMNAYWAAGGGPLYVVRAAYGDCAKAAHLIQGYDDQTTPAKVDAIKFEVKRPGSKRTYLTFTATGTGAGQRLSATFEEEDGITEYFLGVRRSLIPDEEGAYKSALQNLVEKINRESDIVDAYFQVVDEGDEDGAAPSPTAWVQEVPEGKAVYVGSNGYTSKTRRVMGSNAVGDTGNTAGTDGTALYLKAEADQKPFDIISDIVMETGIDAASSPSEVAHTAALKALEQLEIGGVFSLKSNPWASRLDDTQVVNTGDIYAPYVEHVVKMNTPEQHGWRFAIVGANDNMNMIQRLAQAGVFNSELVIFVGQGLVDVNGVEYTPDLATQAVAGKIATTAYNVAIWGGRPSKALKVDKTFITDIMEIPGEPIYADPDADPLAMVGENKATRTEMIAYNEGGVLTFLKDNDGVKVTEGITTVQESYRALGIRREDEIAVMRLIIHAKYEVYAACYLMLGQGINDTFKMDLENSVRSRLAIMVDQGALSEFEAYATVGPVVNGEQGQIQVDISIVPYHAARIIDATIVVL